MTKSTKRRGEQVAGVGCLLFFALFWSGFTLTFDFDFAKASLRQIQALNYSTVLGTITSSKVKASDDGDGTTYRPVLEYTYVVNGKRYEGHRYRYGQLGSSSGSSAHQIVASYPVGRQVEVHHAPGNPADAVLRVGLEGIDFFLMMFMLPFNLIMLVLWLGLLGGVRYRLSRPAAGGAKVLDEGRCLRVQLSPLRPAYIGGAVSGGLAFVLVFLVGFSLGFNPPVAAMILAWGLILSGGGIAAFCAHRKLARGESDLLIDDFRGILVLPRTFGRQEEVVVPSETIVALEVERVEKGCSDGDTLHRYVPTLIYRADDGSQRREKLIEWRDEAAAEGLVQWLGERLRIRPRSEVDGASDGTAGG